MTPRKPKRRKVKPENKPRFTHHEGLGNWFVADENSKRMLCLCTRESDAHYITAVLNKHQTP